MKTLMYPEVKQGTVKDMRSIREQISNEIKDMNFEQERAYFDKLLADKRKISAECK